MILEYKPGLANKVADAPPVIISGGGKGDASVSGVSTNTRAW